MENDKTYIVTSVRHLLFLVIPSAVAGAMIVLVLVKDSNLATVIFMLCGLALLKFMIEHQCNAGQMPECKNCQKFESQIVTKDTLVK